MKLKIVLTAIFRKYTGGCLISCLLIACSSGSVKNKSVFRYNEQTGIATLDPAFAKNQSIIWPVHQLYSTLVETNNDLQIVPLLARSWDVSEDRLSYTFHLRTDILFHDNEAFPGGTGRKMIAGDIVFSFRRIMDKKTASSGAWIFNDKVDPVKGFSALDDSTFQLRLLRPFNPILGLLSMQYCSVVPYEVVQKFGKEFRNHPCGTGPFKFKSWEEGQSLILRKNEHYFEKDTNGNALPYLDAVKITFFDNKATEFLMLQQHQLEFVNDIDPTFKDEVLTKAGMLKKEWQGKILLSKHSYLATEYLGILTDSQSAIMRESPLRLKKVRQAINYGFDRQKMIKYLRNSIGQAAESGFVPAGLPSFDPARVKGYHYDPVKARSLVEEAGFTSGKGVPEIKLLTVPVYADLAAFIAKELEDIGLKIKVDVVQKSLLLEQTAKSQASFFRGSWIADYPDAENYLGVFYSKNPAPPNYTRYSNRLFDQLYEKSLEEKNDSIKYEMYRQMDQLVMNDAPVVPLWYDEVIRLVNPSVRGFEPNSLNLLELRHVKIR